MKETVVDDCVLEVEVWLAVVLESVVEVAVAVVVVVDFDRVEVKRAVLRTVVLDLVVLLVRAVALVTLLLVVPPMLVGEKEEEGTIVADAVVVVSDAAVAPMVVVVAMGHRISVASIAFSLSAAIATPT